MTRKPKMEFKPFLINFKTPLLELRRIYMYPSEGTRHNPLLVEIRNEERSGNVVHENWNHIRTTSVNDRLCKDL